MIGRYARMTLGATAFLLMYSLAWVCCGCASKTYMEQLLEPEQTAPNTNAVLSLASRFGLCHACPIAPDLALTAAHCVDFKPFDASVPAYGSRYSNADGTVTGLTIPLAIANREDLAIIGLTPEVGGYYPLALDEPKLGEPVWWLGYDYRNRKNAMHPRELHGEIVYVVAGSIVIGSKAEEGSSGGCVLNSQGEVVGIITWGLGVGVEDAVALGPGVWGGWADDLITEARANQRKREEQELKSQLERDLDEILRAIEAEEKH